MRYYIIAGERSGDLHGGNLIRAIKDQDHEAEIRCWGGDDMRNAGGGLAVHYREMAMMGFWEVAKSIKRIASYLRFCKRDLVAFAPDVLVLIDFAGFNLRVAKFAKKQGIPVYYYISPKIWAWNRSRAKKIKAYVDRMFVILPFEKDFYKQYDYEVDYVGNPVWDAIYHYRPDETLREAYHLADKPIIAVLPGSRKQEIENILSYMLAVIPRFPEYQFVVAGVDNLPLDYYQKIIDSNLEASQARLIVGKTYDILSHAHAAVVTSGTATLETALFNVPQVVCYKTSKVSYWVAKTLIKVEYIALVNLIMNKPVLRELIQQDLNNGNLTEALREITGHGYERDQQLAEYRALKKALGNQRASETVASLILKYSRSL